MVLICTALIINTFAHLFMSLLAICISSLEKCLFRSSAHFLIRLFFWRWIVWAVYILWILSSSWSYYCKYFLPFSRLSFCFVSSFLCYAKLLSSIRSNLFIFAFIYFTLFISSDFYFYFPSSNFGLCSSFYNSFRW